MPHFYSIACSTADYGRGGMKMLQWGPPTAWTAGPPPHVRPARPRHHAPLLAATAGWVYLAGAVPIGLWFSPAAASPFGGEPQRPHREGRPRGSLLHLVAVMARSSSRGGARYLGEKRLGDPNSRGNVRVSFFRILEWAIGPRLAPAPAATNSSENRSTQNSDQHSPPGLHLDPRRSGKPWHSPTSGPRSGSRRSSSPTAPVRARRSGDRRRLQSELSPPGPDLRLSRSASTPNATPRPCSRSTRPSSGRAEHVALLTARRANSQALTERFLVNTERNSAEARRQFIAPAPNSSVDKAGRIGGFHGVKSDGPIGEPVRGRGLKRLAAEGG